MTANWVKCNPRRWCPIVLSYYCVPAGSDMTRAPRSHQAPQAPRVPRPSPNGMQALLVRHKHRFSVSMPRRHDSMMVGELASAQGRGTCRQDRKHRARIYRASYRCGWQPSALCCCQGCGLQACAGVKTTQIRSQIQADIISKHHAFQQFIKHHMVGTIRCMRRSRCPLGWHLRRWCNPTGCHAVLAAYEKQALTRELSARAVGRIKPVGPAACVRACGSKNI